MYDTTITFRTDSNTKASAQRLFDTLGLDLSTALNIFLRKSVREKSIPFEVSLEEPNKKTLEAISEVLNHPEMTEGPYKTEDEILRALNA